MTEDEIKEYIKNNIELVVEYSATDSNDQIIGLKFVDDDDVFTYSTVFIEP